MEQFHEALLGLKPPYVVNVKCVDFFIFIVNNKYELTLLKYSFSTNLVLSKFNYATISRFTSTYTRQWCTERR